MGLWSVWRFGWWGEVGGLDLVLEFKAEGLYIWL